VSDCDTCCCIATGLGVRITRGEEFPKASLRLDGDSAYKVVAARIGLTESFAVSYTFSVTTRKCHSHSTIEMLVIELLHETYAEIHAVSWVRPPPVT
jgi:hypothetical protein